jgi:hypothetical protein
MSRSRTRSALASAIGDAGTSSACSRRALLDRGRVLNHRRNARQHPSRPTDVLRVAHRARCALARGIIRAFPRAAGRLGRNRIVVSAFSPPPLPESSFGNPNAVARRFDAQGDRREFGNVLRRPLRPSPARAGARRALALERPIDSLESPPDRRAALFVGQDVELLLVDGAHDHRCDVIHVEHASGEIGVGLVLIQHLR